MSDLRRTPGFREVVSEDFRVLGHSMRVELFVVAALMCLLTFTMGLSTIREGTAVQFRPDNFLIVSLLAALLPFGVWKDRSRLRTGSFLVMPVEHRRHVLARVAAGWVWMALVVAALLGWLAIMVVASGGNFGNPGSTYLLLAGAEPLQIVERSTLREFHWVTPRWTWLIALTGPTIGYLLSSAINVASERPLRFVLGAVMAVLMLGFVTGELVFDALRVALDPVLSHPWGLDTVFTGGTESLRTQVQIASWSEQGTTTVWRDIPTFAAYARSTALWSLLAAAALWSATLRFRERA